jgi:hypothetical protein
MINVNIIGYKQFQDSLKKMPSTLRKEVGTRVRAASEQFRDLAIKDAPADVGFLRSQITVKPIDELKYEVVSGSKYSAPMEFGTKSKFTAIPGIDASEFKGQPSGGSYYEFLNNILDWVKRKGIGGKYRGSIAAGKVTLSKKKQDTLVKTAEAIAWSILKNGVKPHPFFFKQIPIVRRDLFRKIRNILSQ